MSDGSEKKEKDTPKAEAEAKAEALTPEESISLLTNIPGVGPKTAEKLAESGYDTIKKVSEGEKEALAAAVTGLSEAKADAVIGEAFDLQEKIDSGEIDLSAKQNPRGRKHQSQNPTNTIYQQ